MMPRKKAQSPKNSTKIRKAIQDAALEAAAKEPWQFVSPLTIAENAGIGLSELEQVFPDKPSILKAIIDDLDAQVESSFLGIDDSISVRDRLFDVLMERIEIANQNRAAHISFFKSFGWTKQSTCSDLHMMKDSMNRMAKCAGMDTEGLFGAGRVAGLSVAYLWVLLIWINDTSPDLGKTMAELDRTLGRAESIAEYFSGN